MDREYAKFAADKAVELLAIDSPTGFTEKAAAWVKAEFEALGYRARLTNKGGVLAELVGMRYSFFLASGALFLNFLIFTFVISKET